MSSGAVGTERAREQRGRGAGREGQSRQRGRAVPAANASWLPGPGLFSLSKGARLLFASTLSQWSRQ